eukprot:TRINITY_DN5458_c0_g1_i1.p1 TRINITY_DN5458_c0_g1~~TRINITY_DN5458_c0_g1_i1.p1  ORF type:complete len:1344 (-),score=185.48 TRINITY_DN5458_c0_g1_i1:80-4111(-)
MVGKSVLFLVALALYSESFAFASQTSLAENAQWEQIHFGETRISDFEPGHENNNKYLEGTKQERGVQLTSASSVTTTLTSLSSTASTSASTTSAASTSTSASAVSSITTSISSITSISSSLGSTLGATITAAATSASTASSSTLGSTTASSTTGVSSATSLGSSTSSTLSTTAGSSTSTTLASSTSTVSTTATTSLSSTASISSAVSAVTSAVSAASSTASASTTSGASSTTSAASSTSSTGSVTAAISTSGVSSSTSSSVSSSTSLSSATSGSSLSSSTSSSTSSTASSTASTSLGSVVSSVTSAVSTGTTSVSSTTSAAISTLTTDRQLTSSATSTTAGTSLSTASSTLASSSSSVSGTTASGTTASAITASGTTASGTTASAITASGTTASGTTASATTASSTTGTVSTTGGTGVTPIPGFDFNWGKEGQPSGDVELFGVATDSNGNTISVGRVTPTGGFNQLLILKYSADKQDKILLWQKRVTCSGEISGNHVITDSEDNVVITGSFSGSIVFQTPSVPFETQDARIDGFVAKYNSDGVELWVAKGQSVGSTSFTGSAIDSNNEIVIVGNFNGNVLNVGGIEDSDFLGTDNFFFAKFSEGGAAHYIRAVDGFPAFATGVSIDDDDNIYIVGSYEVILVFDSEEDAITTENQDAFVLAFAADAENLWGVSANASDGDSFASAVAMDGEGNVVVMGGFTSTSLAFDDMVISPPPALGEVEQQIFLAILNSSSGIPTWIRSAGGIGSSEAHGLAVAQNFFTGTDEIYITGSFSGEMSFDKDTYEALIDTSLLTKDFYLAKFKGNELEWVVSAGDSDSNEESFSVAVQDHVGPLIVGRFDGAFLHLGGIVLVASGSETSGFLAQFASVTFSSTLSSSTTLASSTTTFASATSTLSASTTATATSSASVTAASATTSLSSTGAISSSTIGGVSTTTTGGCLPSERGCDGKCFSGLVNDRCGKCGGDSTSCEVRCRYGLCKPCSFDGTCTCDPEFSILCDSGHCVHDVAECPILISCDSPFLCFDGSCEASPSECRAKGNFFDCILPDSVVCWDGSCKASLRECDSVPSCPYSLPHRCPNGRCELSEADCSAEGETDQCSEQGLSRCEDGFCISDVRLCTPYNGCGLDRPYHCSDHTCQVTAAECEPCDECTQPLTPLPFQALASSEAFAVTIQAAEEQTPICYIEAPANTFAGSSYLAVEASADSTVRTVLPVGQKQCGQEQVVHTTPIILSSDVTPQGPVQIVCEGLPPDESDICIGSFDDNLHWQCLADAVYSNGTYSGTVDNVDGTFAFISSDEEQCGSEEDTDDNITGFGIALVILFVIVVILIILFIALFVVLAIVLKR